MIKRSLFSSSICSQIYLLVSEKSKCITYKIRSVNIFVLFQSKQVDTMASNLSCGVKSQVVSNIIIVKASPVSPPLLPQTAIELFKECL